MIYIDMRFYADGTDLNSFRALFFLLKRLDVLPQNAWLTIGKAKLDDDKVQARYVLL